MKCMLYDVSKSERFEIVRNANAVFSDVLACSHAEFAT